MDHDSNVTVREARGADVSVVAALYRSFVSSSHINVQEDRLNAIAPDPNNLMFESLP